MKIAVLIKRVPDTASVFAINPDQKSVATDKLKFVMSPYDEHAVEEAIKLKEANGADVVVVSLGPDSAKEVMRTALAMGADEGLLVTGAGTDSLTSKGVAEALAAAVKSIGAELVFAGKQAVDDDASQVAERVAELLEMAHASVVTKFELNGGTAVVNREIEGGSYTLELPLPAVITIEKGINTPRYPTLPNIMKAKKKPIAEKSLADLGLSAEALAPGVVLESLSLPRQNRRNHIIDGDTPARVNELIRLLKEEEKAL
ncbi:MAG: electron transfer flavoprotein subunit beta/FixA family protein [Candidatus Hydrogenedentes bacterium]|nr:electron transfer flavoprotein subunit beta/FixA family protein [Candidatus Hydrogenedentota bacterium]